MPDIFNPNEVSGSRPAPVPCTGDPMEARKVFSRLGFGAAVILLLGSALQIAASVAVYLLAPKFAKTEAAAWLLTFVPLYAAAVPAGLLIIRKIPAYPPQVRNVRPADCAAFLLVSVFLMYAGNFLGTMISTALQNAFGIVSRNAASTYASSESLLPKLLFMVILAPMIEEYVFRRALIDRMRPYGGKQAVITSALIFGLFHGNLSQLFYASALGLAFGYIYLKTGRLLYTVLLHMFINFTGSILAPALLNGADSADLSSLSSGFLTYVAALIAVSVIGLAMLVTRRRSIAFLPEEKELPKGARFKTVWLNPGMILLVLSCLGMIVYSIAG